MHALARTDSLTGLRNRRAFDERLTGEISTARRFSRLLSLAIVDIDRFKRVNDEFGHAVGDEALLAVSRAVVAQAGLEDPVARIGGKKITPVMPGTEPRVAAAAEQAPESIRRLALPIGRVTASCGVAQLAGSDANRCDLLRRADRALYRAKASGRDRLALA